VTNALKHWKLFAQRSPRDQASIKRSFAMPGIETWHLRSQTSINALVVIYGPTPGLSATRKLSRNGVPVDRSASNTLYRPHFLQADFWTASQNWQPSPERVCPTGRITSECIGFFENGLRQIARAMAAR
jgi:hypothetical protein